MTMKMTGRISDLFIGQVVFCYIFVLNFFPLTEVYVNTVDVFLFIIAACFCVHVL